MNLFLCGNEGVQMHGGIGMTDEHEICFFVKRSRVAQASFGDTAFCRDRYARFMLLQCAAGHDREALLASGNGADQPRREGSLCVSRGIGSGHPLGAIMV
jgi:hypothetical protein